MGKYRDDREYADDFIPEIKRIVGPHLLSEADYVVDTQQASDLVVLNVSNMSIACRVRRPGYLDNFPWDFTIRSKRDSGADTELGKILDGWADWMFYGHACGDGSKRFQRWFLIDLDIFRYDLIFNERQIKSQAKSNEDGTYFVAYDVRSFEPEMMIASG